MKKYNNFNSLNSKSQREIKNSLKPKNKANLKSPKINKNIFPILNSLLPTEHSNNFLRDKNLSLKRSSTEDFKKNKYFSETINTKLSEEENDNYNEKQEQKNNIYNNKNNYKENSKNKNKMKYSKNKIYFNNKIKEKNKDCNNYYLENTNNENLMNIITVKQAKELKK